MVLDIDGTLVDIEMGGDQIVTALVGEAVEQDAGDEVRDAEGEAYAELIGEVQPIDGAHELIAELSEVGAGVILASSAKADEVEHYLDLLDARELRNDRGALERLAG